MTFNDNAKIDTSRTSRSGRRTGLAVGGGGGLLVVGLFILSQFLGVDLTGLAGGGGGGPAAPEEQIQGCVTGEDANANIECRMAAAANAIDVYWTEKSPEIGLTYSPPDVNLFTESTDTGCGGATSAVGPFYCPADSQIYIDTTFFATLEERFGASAGTLAQMYVLAHEWGHHLQNISGINQGLDLRDTGPASDSVRLEVQADCFAGAWVGEAATVEDENGVTFLKPFTEAQLRDALDAAAAVGDDNIQEATTGQVQPETWTHGSSEQRQKWFTVGYEQGPTACDTFAVNDSEL